MYTYDEIIDRIYSATRFGKLTGREVTLYILEKLNYPMKDIPFIHVAGTNGKGSTCAFLTSILMAEGKKVGTFVSPHLVDFEERIMVNQVYIPKEKVTEYGNLLLEMDFGVELTMFDYCIAMAMLYFGEMKCDIAIMETGLGGTYDSTNALPNPLVSVITKIGFDHMSILGDTIDAIAREKAGIMKENIPVVIQTQEKEALDALLEEAIKKNAGPVHVLTEEKIRQAKERKPGLIGAYQYENAAGAVETAKILGISEGAIQRGISNAKWMGRMEILSKSPFLMVDGAHNGNGVSALARSLRELYPKEKFHFVMGVLADKDYENMIEELLPLAIDFVTVTPETTRALQARDLASCIKEKGIPAECANSLEEALDSLRREEKNVVFGSLYFIGEVEAYWNNQKL